MFQNRTLCRFLGYAVFLSHSKRSVLIIIVSKCTAIHMVFSECTHHSLPQAEYHLDFATNRSDCIPIVLFCIYTIILLYLFMYSHKSTARAIAVRFECGRTVARICFGCKENNGPTRCNAIYCGSIVIKTGKCVRPVCLTRCNAIYCDSIVIETGKFVRPGCLRFYSI